MNKKQRFGLFIMLWAMWGFDVGRNEENLIIVIVSIAAFSLGGVLLVLD